MLMCQQELQNMVAQYLAVAGNNKALSALCSLSDDFQGRLIHEPPGSLRFLLIAFAGLATLPAHCIRRISYASCSLHSQD